MHWPWDNDEDIIMEKSLKVLFVSVAVIIFVGFIGLCIAFFIALTEFF